MKQALQALIAEMEYVLSCINEDKIPFDGDDFHEALRLGKEALAQPEQDKERCVGCEACIDTACGRDECPKGWPKAAQPEQDADKFCDANCTWSDHHPDCKYGKPEQEPVAWRGYNWSHSPDDWVYRDFDDPILDGNGNNVGQPLYTTQPQRTWVGLTDEEVKKIAYNTAERKVAKDIEAKLKEKNDC